MADLVNVVPGVRGAAERLVQRFRALGYRATITSGYRSIAEQRKLYELRQAGRHPYPVAPPGRSEHNWGLAVDISTTAPDAIKAREARAVGLIWFGPRDRVHYSTMSQAEWNRGLPQLLADARGMGFRV